MYKPKPKPKYIFYIIEYGNNVYYTDRVILQTKRLTNVTTTTQMACRSVLAGPTIPHKNNETNDKFYRKVAFLMYTEMVNFRPES